MANECTNGEKNCHSRILRYLQQKPPQPAASNKIRQIETSDIQGRPNVKDRISSTELVWQWFRMLPHCNLRFCWHVFLRSYK